MNDAACRRWVRELAKRVADIADLPIQAERIRLWKTLNALKPERPMVLLNPQNGWADLCPDQDLRCPTEPYRGIENALRMKLFRHESIGDDYPITRDFPVAWQITKSDLGLKETYAYTEARGVFHWDPPIKEFTDIKKLRPTALAVHRDESQRQLDFCRELLGDLLDVRMTGVSGCRCGLTRKFIMLRGLDHFLMDLYDAPDFVHELMAFLRDDMLAEYAFYENEGLLSLNNGPENWTGSGGLSVCDELPGPEYDPDHVGTHNLMAWGESQETVGVGPGQFHEFVFNYQLPILRRFGLVDYGCCEPLDGRYELLMANLPQLRWVAVSPWADRARAAETLTNQYVYCYKPQPSRLCQPNPDWKKMEEELRETLTIARGCCLSIVMKDTTTFCGEPQRAAQWVALALRLAGKR